MNSLHDRFRQIISRASSEPLQALSLLQTENDPPKGGDLKLENTQLSLQSPESDLNLGPFTDVSKTSADEYVQLQRRIYRAVLFLTAFAVGITAFFFGLQASISLMVGALSGILYLRLLARSIGKLGTSSKSVSKIQLLVPVVLVLAVSKISQLELLPSMLGFLLYKPSLIFQILIESRSNT